eukprot:1162108-Pelagomonas_calceolata.AAC.7
MGLALRCMLVQKRGMGGTVQHLQPEGAQFDDHKGEDESMLCLCDRTCMTNIFASTNIGLGNQSGMMPKDETKGTASFSGTFLFADKNMHSAHWHLPASRTGRWPETSKTSETLHSCPLGQCSLATTANLPELCHLWGRSAQHCCLLACSAAWAGVSLGQQLLDAGAGRCILGTLEYASLTWAPS